MKKPGSFYRIPAFFDSHLHFLGLGQRACTIDLCRAKSVAEIKEIVALNIGSSPFVGRGWNQNNFTDQNMITKTDLNQVSVSVPIILYRICGHIAVVNDIVLTEIAKHDPVKGGTIDFKTGIVTENALGLLHRFLSEPSREEIIKYLLKANEILLSQGVTEVMSDDFQTFSVDYDLIIDVINELYKSDKLQVKIIEQVHLPETGLLKAFLVKKYLNKDFGTFRLGPLKLLADGSIGGRTAYLHEPYSDDMNNRGVSLFSDVQMSELFDLANMAGMDCHIHAIGDAAIEQVLTLMEKSLIKTGRVRHRHAIIHAQLANTFQIRKMRDLGISAIVQPIFLESDIAMLDARLGMRKNESYLFRTMYENGVNVGFSTDAPIETANPFVNIYTAMTRTSVKDKALGFHLQKEAFTLEEALLCYRENNLYLAYDEAKDFTDYLEVDRDIFTANPEEILATKVIRTVIGGKTVYERSQGK